MDLGFKSEAAIWASGQCTHLRWYRNGYHRGKQMRVCAVCGACRTDGGVERMTPIKRALLVVEDFKNGITTKQSAIKHGISRQTISRAYAQIERHVPRPDCACGRSGKHLGVCAARRKRL